MLIEANSRGAQRDGAIHAGQGILRVNRSWATEESGTRRFITYVNMSVILALTSAVCPADGWEQARASAQLKAVEWTYVKIVEGPVFDA